METGISMAEQKGLLETRAKGNCSGLHLLQGCNQELEGQKGSSCNRFILFYFFSLLEDHAVRRVLAILDKDTTVLS